MLLFIKRIFGFQELCYLLIRVFVRFYMKIYSLSHKTFVMLSFDRFVTLDMKIICRVFTMLYITDLTVNSFHLQASCQHQLILVRRAVPPTFLGLEGLPPEGREDAVRPVVRRHVQSPEHLRRRDRLWVHPQLSAQHGGSSPSLSLIGWWW